MMVSVSLKAFNLHMLCVGTFDANLQQLFGYEWHPS